MCSYMAMFPPAIPHVFVRWLTSPGDIVYDPFSGRGTTPLEARLLGRIGYGSDLNPLALVLSGAKADPPSLKDLDERLTELGERRRSLDPSSEPAQIKMLFSRETLGELLWLQQELSNRRRADRFLLGTLLGILHANADASGRPRGLTIAMPNTFSMSPGYVAKYIRTHRLRPPRVSPLSRLRERVFSLWRELPASGAVWKRDAYSPVQGRLERTPVKLLFASPPYLDVMKYGKLNWVRLWLLGRSPQAVDAELFASSSLSKYLAFMKGVIHANTGALRHDGYMALVIGDVCRAAEEVDLAQAVADTCVQGSGLRVAGIIADELPIKHKVSRIWKDTRGRATKTDRVLILGARRAPPLHAFPQFAW